MWSRSNTPDHESDSIDNAVVLKLANLTESTPKELKPFGFASRTVPGRFFPNGDPSLSRRRRRARLLLTRSTGSWFLMKSPQVLVPIQETRMVESFEAI